MNTEARQAIEALTPGQLWKLEDGFILITDHGKRLVGYKKLRRANQRGVFTNLIRPEALTAYLSEVEAELLTSPQS